MIKIIKHKAPTVTSVGIPRTLWYFMHPGLWESFFINSGIEPILSKPTSRETVNRAGLISESEHCFPLKLHDAHLYYLAENGVETVFIPRVFSALPEHISCPKLGALSDCAQAQFGDRFSVMTIDIDEARTPLRKSLLELAGKAGVPRRLAADAAIKALAKLAENRRALVQTAESAMADTGKILVLGHPYNIGDSYMSDPVISKLETMGVPFATVDYSQTEKISPEPLKWDMCSIMYDALHRLESRKWAGVIHLSSFNCGCDSMAMEFFRDILKDKKIPYMCVILDEYEGRAGLDTRLEAFIDSIGW